MGESQQEPLSLESDARVRLFAQILRRIRSPSPVPT